MLRTISVPVNLEKEKFLPLMEICADVFNQHIDWGLENQSWNKNQAHHALYYHIRDQFPSLPSALIQAVRDQAMEALKQTDFEKTPRKKPHSGIRYDQRTISIRGNLITLSSLGKRERTLIHIPEKFQFIFKNWKFKGAVLLFIKTKNQFKLQLIFETDTPLKVPNTKIVGIDRGIRHIAVTSDREFFSASVVRANKRKHLYNRKTCKAKGTRSAKRRLRKLSGREKRFSRNVNHCISKQLANSSATTFVLEDLTGIRKGKRRGKKMNKKKANWSFYQLALFLEYKAESRGKTVVYVDPRYTSQKCSSCGNKHATNRDKSRFNCGSCGYSEHSDVNAAINIRNKYVSQLPEWSIEQAVVNQPYVTDGNLVTSLHPCGGGY